MCSVLLISQPSILSADHYVLFFRWETNLSQESSAPSFPRNYQDFNKDSSSLSVASHFSPSWVLDEDSISGILHLFLQGSHVLTFLLPLQSGNQQMLHTHMSTLPSHFCHSLLEQFLQSLFFSPVSNFGLDWQHGTWSTFAPQQSWIAASSTYQTAPVFQVFKIHLYFKIRTVRCKQTEQPQEWVNHVSSLLITSLQGSLQTICLSLGRYRLKSLTLNISFPKWTLNQNISFPKGPPVLQPVVTKVSFLSCFSPFADLQRHNSNHFRPLKNTVYHTQIVSPTFFCNNFWMYRCSSFNDHQFSDHMNL